VARSSRDDPEQRPLADPEDDWAVPADDRLRQARAPQGIGDLLEGFIDRRGWADRLRSTAVFRHWEQIVGPQLAGRCEPVRLAGGVLVVRAESQSWATQVKYLTGTLKRRAHEVLGQPVTQLEIVIGPLQGSAGEHHDRDAGDQ